MIKSTIKLLVLMMAAKLLFLMSVSGAAAETSKHPDIQCFLLVDRPKDNNFHKFEMTDHSGTKVSGYIANRPFLSSDHLLEQQVTVEHSRTGKKKGKAYLSIPLNAEGQKIMFATTSHNNLYRIAIFINGELQVAPQIREGYPGPLIIEGGYLDAEAERISEAIKGK